MSIEIKAFIVMYKCISGYELSTDHNYDFSFSNTGSVKFTGIYKPKYFKKDVLNSYESIKIGKNRFFLFTSDFDLDKNKCCRSMLQYFFSNTEIKIEQLKEHLILLGNELKKY